jgi:hypothetical protein
VVFFVCGIMKPFVSQLTEPTHLSLIIQLKNYLLA